MDSTWDRYARTLFDFWGLKPARFISARQAAPESYVPPYQFLVATLGLYSVFIAASANLTNAAIHSTDPKFPTLDAALLATISICGAIFFYIMTTVLSWLAARLPLVRKKPAMSALFELQCYMVGMALPFVFTYYVVWPIVSFFVIQNIMPIWSMLIPGICVAAASVWYFFAYYCPGVAYLSGTTPLRFSIAYIVSTFLVGFIVGFVFGFVQGFLSAMH